MSAQGVWGQRGEPIALSGVVGSQGGFLAKEDLISLLFLQLTAMLYPRTFVYALLSVCDAPLQDVPVAYSLTSSIALLQCHLCRGGLSWPCCLFIIIIFNVYLFLRQRDRA